jgi:hypothetical protein
MGGAGSIVEVDETFIGKKDTYAKRKNSRSYHHKQAGVKPCRTRRRSAEL